MVAKQEEREIVNAGKRLQIEYSVLASSKSGAAEPDDEPVLECGFARARPARQVLGIANLQNVEEIHSMAPAILSIMD